MCTSCHLSSVSQYTFRYRLHPKEKLTNLPDILPNGTRFLFRDDYAVHTVVSIGPYKVLQNTVFL